MSMDHIISAAKESADSPFVPGTTLQFAWDSVSLTSFLTCPRRYQYQILEGYAPKAPSFAIALVFGILFHKGAELYHKAKAAGSSHDLALHSTVAAICQMPETQELPADAEIEQMAEAEDEDSDGITYRNSKVRTRYHLIRALVWYLDAYEHDALKTIILPSGEAAVEVSFRVDLPLQIAGHPLLLCGHLDRVVSFNDYLYNTDYKTTKSITQQYFDMFDLSHQMTGYKVGGEVIFERPIQGVWIDAIALQVGGVKLGRKETRRSAGQVREYFELLGNVAQQAEAYALKGFYPMNTAGCYFCEFKAICRQPPEHRGKYLNQLYRRSKGWNPLENR